VASDFISWTNAELIEEINKLQKARKLGLVWESKSETLADALAGQISVLEDIQRLTLFRKNEGFNFVKVGSLSLDEFIYKKY